MACKKLKKMAMRAAAPAEAKRACARAIRALFALVPLLPACGSSPPPPGSAGADIEPLVASVCSLVDALPCGPQDCASAFLSGFDSGAGADCANKYAGWLACVRDSPMGCNGDRLVVGEHCGSAEQEYRACELTAHGCAGGTVREGTTQTCTVQCGDVSASCEGPAGGVVSCQCAGSKSGGKKFESFHCPPSAVLVQAQCSPG